MTNASEKTNAAVYSVWCDGAELNDYYLTKRQAESLAFAYERRGYKNPVIRKEKGLANE